MHDSPDEEKDGLLVCFLEVVIVSRSEKKVCWSVGLLVCIRGHFVTTPGFGFTVGKFTLCQCDWSDIVLY